MNPNVKFWIGMFASILVAVAGMATQIDPPWDKALALAGLVGTAINGVLIQRGRDEWDFQRRENERDRIAGFQRSYRVRGGYPPLPRKLPPPPKAPKPPGCA
jgi:hypothetical protein